jgi:uncharacterized damage-inducible protein DinB
MSQVALWFDRKFDFAFPVELWPNVCMRLRGAPARLEELLEGRSHALLIRRPQPQKWSIQEHAGHLADLEPLWSARVDDYPGGAKQLTVADLSNRGTEAAQHNERDLKQILSKFRKARLDMVDRVEKLDPGRIAHSIPHPRLQQPMRLVDHLYFVAEHDDHHLARMWELLRSAKTD